MLNLGEKTLLSREYGLGNGYELMSVLSMGMNYCRLLSI